MIETIFVVGPAGSGKSAFAAELSKALAARTGKAWPVAETSAALFRWLARIQAAGPWPAPEHGDAAKWEAYLRANKERYRPMLVELGNVVREAGFEFSLTVEALSEHADFGEDASRFCIVTGLRYVAEIPPFLTDEGELAPMGCSLVYVDRPDFPSQADGFEAEAFRALAEHVVTNVNGDVGALQTQAQMLAEKLANG